MINACYRGCCLNDEDVKLSSEMLQRRKTLSVLKTCAFVLGLLLIIGAGVCYTQNINAIVSHSLVGGGLASFIGSIVWSVVHCKSIHREGDDHRASVIRWQVDLAQENITAGKQKDFSQPWDAIIKAEIPIAEDGLPMFLTTAAGYGRADAVTNLFERGAVPSEDAMIEAIRSIQPGSVECMKLLLQKSPQLATPREDYTPLAYVLTRSESEETLLARWRFQKVAELLKVNTSEVNTQFYGMTALQRELSAAEPYIGILELLKDAGANWDIDKESGKSPRQMLQDPRLETWRNRPEVKERLAKLMRSLK